MHEKEYHPRLDLNSLRLNQQRIILGSFPIWSLSANLQAHHNNDNNAVAQDAVKKKEFPYFYGSSKNKFWSWYKTYFDVDVLPSNVESIKNSLQSNHIGITDVILSCKRKGKSSLDKDLYQRTYNLNFFLYPKLNETLKILCTSKGVMNEMLLCNEFFTIHTKLKLNQINSEIHQKRFIEKTNGDPSLIRKPIFIELNVESGGKIQCLSIPSPGSPYRKLNDFGIFEVSNLDTYLIEAFNWLKDQ